MLRVLIEAGVHLPGRPPRERRDQRPFPDWAELVPGVIWIYDFTHFRASQRCAVAVLDVVSRYWLATVVSAEESSTQVEVAFTPALIADGKEDLLDQPLLDELTHGIVPDDDDRVPVLLAVSDNGPQMTSRATAVFLAGARIAQHFGRPSTPNDQAWIESFFGHLKGEWPHLDRISDPGDLEAELDRLQAHYNTVRLHEGIGYLTPTTNTTAAATPRIWPGRSSVRQTSSTPRSAVNKAEVTVQSTVIHMHLPLLAADVTSTALASRSFTVVGRATMSLTSVSAPCVA